jgi:hypothetical protein
VEKENLDKAKDISKSNLLPPHVLKVAEESIKLYENGQTISFEEFKQRHFSKK